MIPAPAEDIHAAAARSVFDRVVDEVENGTLEPLMIAFQVEFRNTLELERNVLVFSDQRERFRQIPQQCGHINALSRHSEFSGFSLSQSQELLNHAAQFIELFNLACQRRFTLVERLAV